MSFFFSYKINEFKMKTNMFHNIIDKVEKVRTQFGYKPVCS